jgi:photosystem II stability/assembly factor-like uncharacterized protein
MTPAEERSLTGGNTREMDRRWHPAWRGRLRLALLLSALLGINGPLWGDTGPPPPSQSAAEMEAEQRARDGLLRDILFLDPRRGFAVSQGGILLATADGGATWRAERLPQAGDVWQVVFQNQSTGWIVAGYSAYKTQDGGRTWRRAALYDRVRPYARRLRFVTPQVGWLVGRGVYVSQDGGATWAARQPYGTVDLYDIACFAAAHCIAVGDTDTVLTTTDTGHTWIRRTLPIRGSYAVHRVQIAPDGVVWALAHVDRDGILVRSTDQGQTWTVVGDGFPVMDFNSFTMLDGKRGMFAAIGIYRTLDAGVTFEQVAGPRRGSWLSTVFFLTERLGWAAGQFQTIVHTQDGGQTWTLQHESAPRAP